MSYTFGTLFNNIYVTRENSAGETVSLLKVPLAYAPKDKMLARITSDPNLDKQSGLTLPRMSFELTNMYYDGDRKLKSTGRVVRKSNDPNKNSYQYNPVPYNFNFTLFIYVKNAEDGTKIVEQILPYFTPEWNATLNLIPELDIKADIPIQTMSVRSEDVYDGNFETRRSLIWTLDFMLKGYLYGPIKTAPIIKFANTSFYIPGGNAAIANTVGTVDSSARITVAPGLTANGLPTSNSSLSINRDLIEADDNFGYIITPSGIIIAEND